MKFKKVILHAFRAYKDKKYGTFDFTLTNDEIANFISIYAPNGLGKTSFYDGVEWGMTNNIRRLDKQSDIANSEKKYKKEITGESEKQYILKNKDTDDNIESYVELNTTTDNFKRAVPKIRKGSKDFFNKKHKAENSWDALRNLGFVSLCGS